MWYHPCILIFPVVLFHQFETGSRSLVSLYGFNSDGDADRKLDWLLQVANWIVSVSTTPVTEAKNALPIYHDYALLRNKGSAPSPWYDS